MNLLFIELGSAYAHDLAKVLSNAGFVISHYTVTKERTDIEGGGIYAPYLFQDSLLQKHYGQYFKSLDRNLVEYFIKTERDFMMLTDRCFTRPESFQSRKKLFYDLIRFWTGFLEKEKIDCIYFPCTPHSPWEYVLLKAAEFLEIPFCYLSHTAINNRSLFRNSFRTIEKVPEDYLEACQEPEEIKKHINPELLHDFEEESIVTNVVKLENDSFQKQIGKNSDIQKYQSFTKAHKKSIIRKAITTSKEMLRSVMEFLKLKDRPHRLATAMNQSYPLFYWEMAVLKHWWHAYTLKKQYNKLTRYPDLEKPYIYFPLHLQPELTTHPEGGVFEDQFLALETILQALPEGWKVFVKENPRQFDVTINKASGRFFRTSDDYTKMLKNPNVCLMPQDIKSEELIKNAKITATITGTAGWEALNLGKVCMTFARPWYSACQSCCIVETQEQIAQALRLAESKNEQDVYKDVLKYLAYYGEKLAIATLHAPSDVSYNSRDYEEILSEHAAALRKYFMN